MNEDKKSTVYFKILKGHLPTIYPYVFFAIVLMVSSTLSEHFFSSKNLINLLMQNVVIIIMSVGQLFVTTGGEIDLSVGSIAALSACLVSRMLIIGFYPWVAIIVVAVIAASIGLLNGSLIYYGRSPSFMITLSMMSLIYGIAYSYQSGLDFRISNSAFLSIYKKQIAGIPWLIIYLFLFILFIRFIFRRTVYGRAIVAIGENRQVSADAGIKIGYYILSTYLISGILAGFGGILTAAKLGSGTALIGRGAEIDSVAAVLIGGGSLKGGRGSVTRTVVGALILGISGNVLNLLAVGTSWQLIFKGLVILIAMFPNGNKISF